MSLIYYEVKRRRRQRGKTLTNVHLQRINYDVSTTLRDQVCDPVALDQLDHKLDERLDHDPDQLGQNWISLFPLKY